MAVVRVTRVVLECDGCQAVFGAPGYASPVEMRAAAYAAGWRFPNKVNRTSGKPTSSANDVCTACAPGWTPQSKPNQQRDATAAELEQWS